MKSKDKLAAPLLGEIFWTKKSHATKQLPFFIHCEKSLLNGDPLPVATKSGEKVEEQSKS
jgi:hypothetical protein